MWVAAATGVAPEQQGVASATASTSQQIGSAVGLAVLVAIAAPASRSGIADFVGGLQTAVHVSAGLTLLGVLIAFAIPSPKAAQAPAASEPGTPGESATTVSGHQQHCSPG